MRGARRWTIAAAALLLAAQAAGAESLGVRWLGVAGFSLSDGDTTLLFDPFFSRPGLWDALFGDYVPDASVLAPLLEAGSPAPELARAVAILVGHSHYDHLGDAPWIAARSGATLVGSLTSLNIARGYALPAERTRRADPGDALAFGAFRVRVVESRHAKVLFGRVPFAGEVSEPLDGPVHAASFVLGDARGYLVTHVPSGTCVFVLSSAAIHRPALEALRDAGVQADVLLAPSQGREVDYVAALVSTLRPRLVVPHHFDDFTEPLAAPDAGAPGDPDDVAAFGAEVRAAAAAEGLTVEVRQPVLFEAMEVPLRRAGDGP